MTDIQATIEQVFREERGRILATLISQLGDFSLAEDALQDALIIALEKWTTEGVPRNPAAWITTIAKRRVIDRVRRNATLNRKQTLLKAQLETETETEEQDEVNSFPDERLKLMFTCCHPSLALEAQVALTLRTLGGLTTEEIARAFLVSVPTMTQRITRAKNKIHDAGIPFRIPPVHLLTERLDALLGVIYLIFNEGYCATREDALIRHHLCYEAIYLCRVLVDLLPNTVISAEARGLLALMLLHDSRRLARVDKQGELVLLADQDRSLWRRDQIDEGVELLQRTLRMGNVGVYQVQAAISALHAEASTYENTDWAQIAELYGVLAQLNNTFVVKVNRAVAVGMAQGAQIGLRLLLELEGEIEDYYPYHVARADLLHRTHQLEASMEAYQSAIDLCPNGLERAYLQKRLAKLSG